MLLRGSGRAQRGPIAFSAGFEAAAGCRRTQPGPALPLPGVNQRRMIPAALAATLGLGVALAACGGDPRSADSGSGTHVGPTELVPTGPAGSAGGQGLPPALKHPHVPGSGANVPTAGSPRRGQEHGLHALVPAPEEPRSARSYPVLLRRGRLPAGRPSTPRLLRLCPVRDDRQEGADRARENPSARPPLVSWELPGRRVPDRQALLPPAVWAHAPVLHGLLPGDSCGLGLLQRPLSPGPAASVTRRSARGRDVPAPGRTIRAAGLRGRGRAHRPARRELRPRRVRAPPWFARRSVPRIREPPRRP